MFEKEDLIKKADNLFLTDRDKDVLELRNSMTLQTIGDKYQLTRERIRQIEEFATNIHLNNAKIFDDLFQEIGNYLFIEKDIERGFMLWYNEIEDENMRKAKFYELLSFIMKNG
ncbi:MAG TPA: sigma factor-like helix-turn-helix DNA-binding protein [Candidatus Lokiarchaeia archaeon]